MKFALELLLLSPFAGASVLRAGDVRLATGNATQDFKDAAAIEHGVRADVRSDLRDAAAIRSVAGLRASVARAELERASFDAKDGAAVEKADKLWSADEVAQGDKELKDAKDKAQLAKAVDIEVKDEDKEAAEMKSRAGTEKAEAEATMKEVARMTADANQIERKAMGKLEKEGADVQTIVFSAGAEAAAAKRSCTATAANPTASLLVDTPNMVHGETVEFCGEGQLKVAEGSCPDQATFDSEPAKSGLLYTNGGASDCKDIACPDGVTPCCMAFKCGPPHQAWER